MNRELPEGIHDHLMCLHLDDGMLTPDEAEQQVEILENIRGRIEEEIYWIHTRTIAQPEEPSIGFPGMNFLRPLGALPSKRDEG
jgi:hypothetical protein